MKKIITLAIVNLFVLGSILFNPVFGSTIISTSFTCKVLYVGGTDGGNYSTIQEAIDDANPGDTVFVFNGTYYENVWINKSIQLIGENEEYTIINGMNRSNGIIVESLNVTIKHLKITNTKGRYGGVGITKNSDHTKILNCIFINNDFMGIFIENTVYVTIENCRFYDNLVGIGLKDSNYSTINNCDCRNDQWNIYLSRSNNNKILNCIIDKSSSNLGNDGVYLIYSSDNEIYNCTISNRGDAISLYDDSSYNIIDKCNIYSNRDRGIVISNSIQNKISNSTITNCESGVEFYGNNYPEYQDSELNTIDNCIISGNKEYGILFNPDCNYNKVINSEISSNKNGVICGTSTYKNQIYNNKFINNIEDQAYDAGNNIWDNSYPNGGNYWSDYKGVDQYNGPNQDILGSDGIGDTPYAIPGGEHVDHYPLVALDKEDPIVKIEKPINGLYLFNLQIRKFHLQRLPLIICRMIIKVNATDNDSGIRNVEFYIDGKLKANDTIYPYEYKWTRNKISLFKHRHVIKVVAFDYSGNSASCEKAVRKFL